MRARLGWLVPSVLGLVFALTACAGGGGGGDDDVPQVDSGGMPGDPDAAPASCPGGCTSPEKCCNVGGSSFCINTSADLNNCGACGNVCDPLQADSCGGSQCKCGFAPACTGSAECCDTGCKDLDNDALNCGMCGRACGLNSSCNGGECVCAATGGTCGAGQACCADGCKNTMTDNANCGGCGTPCGAGETCLGGVCTCGGSGVECSTGQGCCGGGCVDICLDINNCGTCGHVCSGMGNACFLGACLLDFPPTPSPECM